MKVSKQFMRDFAYLANRYGWTPEDIEEIKAHTREHPQEMQRYWSNLAIAHQAGYEQKAENGFMRLAEWCQLRGLPHPSTADLSRGWHE